MLTVNLICQNQLSLDTNKATGPDGIPAKFIQISANVIDCPVLANIITCDISKKKYSEHAKTATVRPIFKIEDRTKIKNYQPVSLLNIFSKLCERFLHENLTNYVNTFLSKFISAYRKSYSTHQVFIRLIENWKKSQDEKKFVGAVLMDLLKAFSNFADDNTITAAERTIESHISTLETESQAATEWFKLNEMIVNPEKFYATAVKEKLK